MKKRKHFKLAMGLTVVLAGLGFLINYCHHLPSIDISRAQMTEILQNHRIVKAIVSPSIYTGIYSIDGTFQPTGGSPASAKAKPQEFSITTHLNESQIKDLSENPAVKIEVPGKTSKGQWINIVATLAIMAVITTLLLHQVNIGKAKATHKIKERPSVRFRDIAGVEEAKGEVLEVVDFLRNPKKYNRVGGKLPKGILLMGPPGTGKTMLAKAIAGEAEANFFSAHGSDFNEVFVGVGAKRIREIFRQAAKHKPAIIFIDEIDCLGKNRKLDSHGELQQTNNALLAAMDGFEGSDGIVVIGATNRPEDLDDALMRPGRFDRKVHVPYPDMKGRRAILQTHARNKPIADEEKTLDIIAQTTPGMSGADLANLINEAAILCAQQSTTQITLTEMEASRDKVRFGKERTSMVLKKREREMVAYHEAGHTVINLQKSLLPPLYKVSIVPRGQALGVTTFLPDEDQNLQSKALLLQELVVLMGGRAAEQVFYGATTNGANGDLEMAKRIARKMVHEWGMGERLYYEPEQKDAELEINRLLETADREALAIIHAQKWNTDKLAKALLARETLTRQEVVDLFKGNPHSGEAPALPEKWFPI